MNPKLWKLALVEPLLAAGEVLVVRDDDTRVPLPSLGALLSGLREGTVATGLPAYLDRGPWQARMVGQFVNNNAAQTYLSLLPVLDPVTLNGMAYAIKTADLSRLGGFTPLQHYLTDDLAVGAIIRAAGEHIVQTASPQWISTSVDSTEQYVSLMHRWFLFASILLRRQPAPVVRTIVAVHGAPPMLVWAALTSAALRPTRRSVLTVGILLASRAAILTALQRRVFGLVWPQLVGPVLYTPQVQAPEPPFVAGRRHVLVTCGTHLRWHRAQLAQATAQAAAALPDVESHLSDGDASSARHESVGNFQRLGYVSYQQYLHRYSLVVHHAGAGVLAHTLAAGLPAIVVPIVVPVDYDQFDFAVRLHVAGVALPLRRLSHLPGLIAKAREDRALRAAALRFRDLGQAPPAQDRIAHEVATFLGTGSGR